LADETTAAVDRAEAQLRKLWSGAVLRSEHGRGIVEFVTAEAPTLTDALLHDEEAFALAVAALGPWLGHGSSTDVLDATIDQVTVDNLSRLAKRVSVLAPSLHARIDQIASIIRQAEGKQVRDVLGVTTPD
jgi:hypothetical protein